MITKLMSCTAIVLVQVATANCNAEVLLRWRLSEGAHLRVSLTQSIKSETSVGERTEAISFESRMETDWRIDRTDDDGSIHLTQSYERFRLKSDPPDAEPAVYDSSSADEPPDQMRPIARAMRPLIGLRTFLVLSERGEILEAIQPPETKSLLGDLPSTSRWRQMLTTEGMERVLQQALGLLPEGPVEMGDSWAHTRDVQSPIGPLRIESRYTYDGTVPSGERILQRIRGSTTTQFTERDTTGGASQTLRHRPQPALYLLDNDAGYLVESHVTQAVGSEVPYGDATVRVKTSGTVTLKIVSRER